MKTRMMAVACAVLLGGWAFKGAAQMIKVGPNNDITFRSSNTSNGTTVHYGDLAVTGVNSGSFSCMRAVIYNGLSVHAWMSAEEYIRSYGDLQVFHDLWVSGTKYFIHPHPTDDTKLIRYVATESSEALTLARGTAKTVNGEATVKLPEHFSLVTSDKAPITAIITPEGAPVLLYTKEKSKNQIVVAMKKSDFTEFRDVEFAYQVTGVRDGFEDQEVIIDEDKLNAVDSRPKNEVQKRIDAYRDRAKARHEKKYEQVGK